MTRPSLPHLLERAAAVRLLLTDVDGVLTDGGLYYLEGGGEAKRFHVRDGLGLVRARRAGLLIGVLSGRRSAATERRARELGLDEIHLGVEDKEAVFESILARHELTPEETCFVGDDLNDLALLKRVGLPAAPADGVPEVRQAVLYVTRCPGGHGAFREVVDLLLRARAPARG